MTIPQEAIGNDGLTDDEREQYAREWREGQGKPFTREEIQFIQEWAAQRRLKENP